MFRHVYMSATGNGTIGGTGGWSVLAAVVVNSGAASAVLTLRSGTSAGAVIAVLDCSAAREAIYMVQVPNGIYWALTGGNADVTIVYE